MLSLITIMYFEKQNMEQAVFEKMLSIKILNAEEFNLHI